MELSASLDTYRPNSAALFRSVSAGSKSELIENEGLRLLNTQFVFSLINTFSFQKKVIKTTTWEVFTVPKQIGVHSIVLHLLYKISTTVIQMDYQRNKR